MSDLFTCFPSLTTSISNPQYLKNLTDILKAEPSLGVGFFTTPLCHAFLEGNLRRQRVNNYMNKLKTKTHG
ncbi:hypothetical protein VB264_15780 [Arcicella aquatica]|uniref:Uncharacterized protein n=1 Tax=Arcicella aquatica TaxID=217141 RepID=A0ABU5QQ94_9BACT|nr:hypothetical protein [Arcicella aquatica]MEA5259257.1 hypothetical protein [Arcicella aquatica]